MAKRIWKSLFVAAVAALCLAPVCAWANDGTVAIDSANFPDDAFRKIVTARDKNKDGSLSETEIEATTNLFCYGRGISDLTGIEHFTALKSLDVSHNDLSRLDLSKNTQLISLYCDNNQLKQLDISALSRLTDLYCSDNQLQSLDASKNLLLESLCCQRNSLTKLAVSGLGQLTWLECYSNQLSSIDLSGCTALTDLSLGRNPLASLDLSDLTALNSLNCNGAQLTSLDVSGNPSLWALFCDENSYAIEVDANRSFELTALPGNFDAARASNWSGGTVSGSILTVEPHAETVTYSYECDANKTRTFTLNVGHTWKTTWSSDSSSHWRECSACGEKTDAAEHSYSKATCTAPAACETCGYEHGEVDATNHEGLVHIAAKDATDTTEGNVEYWHCTGCGKYYSDASATKEIQQADTVIPAKSESREDKDEGREHDEGESEHDGNAAPSNTSPKESKEKPSSGSTAKTADTGSALPQTGDDTAPQAVTSLIAAVSALVTAVIARRSKLRW